MYEIGSKVRITGLDAIGIITAFDITRKYAHVNYIFIDDEEKSINYGCFDVSKLRI